MTTPTAADLIVRRLGRRVAWLCSAVFVLGGLLPAYVPQAALAPPEADAGAQQFLLVEDGFLMKSSSFADQGSRLAYSEGSYHKVKDGESLDKLANRYGISKETILWANHMEPGTSIQPGQELLILPVDGVLHTVTRGQTLLGIAEMYGIPIADIERQNKIKGGFIRSGGELIIPGATPLLSKPVEVARVDVKTPLPASPKKPVPTKPGPAQDVFPDGDVTPSYTDTPTPGVLQKPCSDKCFITQYYHAGHYALDMQERGGGPIFAAENGTVIRADSGWNGGYGNVIEIEHSNGLITLYGHNKSFLIKAGDTVKRGQQIAWMGKTGLVYGATGIHVHFEVRQKGVKKNPLLYIQ